MSSEGLPLDPRYSKSKSKPSKPFLLKNLIVDRINNISCLIGFKHFRHFCYSNIPTSYCQQCFQFWICLFQIIKLFITEKEILKKLIKFRNKNEFQFLNSFGIKSIYVSNVQTNKIQLSLSFRPASAFIIPFES